MNHSPTADAAASLKVVSPAPFNAETRFETQSGLLTPPGRHYVRNHFSVPEHDGVLRIDGAVSSPIAIAVATLRDRATWSSAVTLECAGNGRSALVPPAPGEQWGLGAVGTAEWTGVPLLDLLAEAGLKPGAVELVFAGADRGTVAAIGRTIGFERSLPIADAGAAFVAVEMNGRPLTPNHGAPIRLLVPGRYGMASVKWLSLITAVSEPFRGFFQVDRYIVEGRPLGPIAPRAVIASPAPDETVPIGETVIRGYAWSGRAPIERVAVSTDGGASWSDAVLGPMAAPTAWRAWQSTWRPTAAGTATLLARATDATGATQPLEQVRTDLGYGNNAAQPVSVSVS